MMTEGQGIALVCFLVMLAIDGTYALGCWMLGYDWRKGKWRK